MKSLGLMLLLSLSAIFAQAFPGQGAIGAIGEIGPQYSSDSFRQTCDVVYEDYRRIQAYCEDRGGRMVFNDFDRSMCNGEIANMNGRLICTNDVRLPPGSYQVTCRSCQVRYPQLECQCEDMRGYFRFTSLFLPRCGGAEISNLNGRLVCR